MFTYRYDITVTVEVDAETEEEARKLAEDCVLSGSNGCVATILETQSLNEDEDGD